MPRAHARRPRARARGHDGARRAAAEAALVEVLRPRRRAGARRPARTSPRCGGCAYQDVDYGAQLALKEAVLRESLARAGAPWEGAIAVHAVARRAGGRAPRSTSSTRATAGLRLGLHEEGSHRVVDIERCLQLSDGHEPRRRAASERPRRAAAARPRASATLELRSRSTAARLVASLETQPRASRSGPRLARRSANGARRAHRLRRAATRAALARVAARGTPYVEASVHGLTLRAHVRVVLPGQPLPGRAARAHGASSSCRPAAARPRPLRRRRPLRAAAGRRATACETVAVEQSTRAAEDARASAERRRASRRAFAATDVERALARLPPRPGERDRARPAAHRRGPRGRRGDRGAAARRDRLRLLRPADPRARPRDLRGRGYRPDTVRAFDMFPDTFHLETVVRLRP